MTADSDRCAAVTQHTCGLTVANVLFCWGYNQFGALGDGTTVQRPRPVKVSGGLTFRQVSAGFYHTCGITTADRVYCWGLNVNGRLGDGTTTQRLDTACRGRWASVPPGKRGRPAYVRGDRGIPGLLLGQERGRRARRRHHGSSGTRRGR